MNEVQQSYEHFSSMGSDPMEVYNGNYQAVGFIVAAKSILRFRESEGARAEYVLVGTLLSFSIAVLCAMAVLWIKHECL